MFDYEAYAIALRREIHEYPEIGFDLPKTLAVVRRELDAMGIEYTEKYGRSSIVGTINEGKPFTIGLRADMDALPVQEQTGLPFASKIDGQMHACGHDTHTAMLLAVAKLLNERKDEINCCVKLLFTPAEEYITPGAKEMAENGVMDDIDCAVACHIAPTKDVGQVAVIPGGANGNSMGFTIEFFGTTSHAARQQSGKDAIMMAVEAISAMQAVVAHEIDPIEPRLLNVGSIHGGSTNNVICDYCKLFCSSRTHSDEVTQYILDRATQISQSIAQMNGGSAKVTVNKFLPYVLNNEIMTERLKESAARVVGEENIFSYKRGMGGEDFAFFSRIKPCVQFRLGVRSEDPRSAKALHNAEFTPDERALGIGVRTFVQFVMDNMNGIEF